MRPTAAAIAARACVRATHSRSTLAAIAALSVAVAFACATSACAKVPGNRDDAQPGPGDSAPPPSGDDASLDVGPNHQVICPGGGSTTISGTAYAPNGKLPLYNVVVSLPTTALEPFKPGVTCDRCGAVSGHPIASAISDQEGKFKLTNVPVGRDVPLVLQVGKWRRKVTIPSVVACQDNPITDPNLTRLPRNRGEGDLPRIALLAGLCDRLGCLLPKVGLDPAEIGVAGEDRAVTFYAGWPWDFDQDRRSTLDLDAPSHMTDAETLWRSEDELSKYDMTLLSCECAEILENKGPLAYQAMTKYLNKGGRMFGSHFMYVWYQNTPDPTLATAMTLDVNRPLGENPMHIDTTFPKGKALADWMKFVDPTLSYGEIDASEVFDDVTSAMMPTGQAWARSAGIPDPMMASSPSPLRPRIVTINTPARLPANQQCGRAVFLDAHISTFGDDTSARFPANCGGDDLNRAEIALAFLFFDLGACIQGDVP